MDGLPFEIPLFLLVTFGGALVAGLSGVRLRRRVDVLTNDEFRRRD